MTNALPNLATSAQAFLNPFSGFGFSQLDVSTSSGKEYDLSDNQPQLSAYPPPRDSATMLIQLSGGF
jgi:hypothetical protein